MAKVQKSQRMAAAHERVRPCSFTTSPRKTVLDWRAWQPKIRKPDDSCTERGTFFKGRQTETW